MPSIIEHKIYKAAKKANLRTRYTDNGVVYISLAGGASLAICMNLEETRISRIRWRHPDWPSKFITVKDALILIEDSTK